MRKIKSTDEELKNKKTHVFEAVSFNVIDKIQDIYFAPLSGFDGPQCRKCLWPAITAIGKSEHHGDKIVLFACINKDCPGTIEEPKYKNM